MRWHQRWTLLGGTGPASLQAKRPTVSDLDFAETVESFIQADFEKLPRSVDGSRFSTFPRHLYAEAAGVGGSGSASSCLELQ
jgi:hypothetical protein